MSDTRRLDSLKRRVQQDPSSIAFAALADEYRRLGLFHDAIETCRAGLTRHPAYLSARVTLGRSLLEIGEYDEAQTELQQVIRAAPDNLAAIRAMADIHRRRGDAPDSYTVHLEGLDPAAAAAAPPVPAATGAGGPGPEGSKPIEPPETTAASPGAAANVERADVPRAESVSAAAPPAPLRLSTVPADAPPLEVTSHMAPPEPVPGTLGTAAPGPAAPEEPAPAPPAPSEAMPIDPICERLEQFLAAIDRARSGQDRDGVAQAR